MIQLQEIPAANAELAASSVLTFPEGAPADSFLAEPQDVRRSDTIHGRSRNTAHDQPRTPVDGSNRTTRSEPTVPATCRRRSEARHPLRQALVAIPVLPDGSPDAEQRLLGISVDLSCQGIGLELQAPARFPTSSLVLLLTGPDGTVCCAGMEIRYAVPSGQGQLRVGGPFGGFGGEILLPDNLQPTFQRQTMEFSLGLPAEVLRKWAQLGVLQPVLLDRVQLCPKCHGLPSFRQACPSCGSALLTNDQLIHHFACAHVGLVSDYEGPGELICPKCRMRQLVVGSDYEYCTGPYRCLNCHWSDTELEHVAQCLRCEFRFPAHQAYEHELRGFLANRLDPRALLDIPGFDPQRCPESRSAARASRAFPEEVALPVELGAELRGATWA